MSKSVSILIVSYNTVDLTVACIQSIFDQSEDVPFEVIVVDNASSDGSADEIAKRFPNIRLVRSADNIGFGRGNNLAAQTATGDYILLLNPDTVVLDHAVDKIVRFARSVPDALVWGGKTVFPDGTLNPTSVWRFLSLWSLLTQAIGLNKIFPCSDILNREAYPKWPRDTVREVEMVTGCFLLITHDLWRRLDGFDDGFFMYSEETDLCFRARKMGARPMFTPEATVVHYDGASKQVPSAKRILLLTGKAHYMRKNWSPVARLLGIGLLKLHVGLRVVGGQGLALIKRGDKQVETAKGWKNVWSARKGWTQGFVASDGRQT